MGDVRYEHPYKELRAARDRALALRVLSDEDVIEALAAASRENDPYLANVLATEALNRARRLRAALAHMAEGVVDVSLDLKIRWLNAAAERLLSCTRRDVLGRDVIDLLDPRDERGARIESTRSPFVHAATSATPQHGMGIVLRALDGKDICVDLTCAAILGPEGEPTGIVVVFRDAGSRKAIEYALEESRQRYQTLFELAPDPIITMGVDGTVLDANPQAEAMTGVPKEASRGRPFTEFIHPDDGERMMRVFQEALAGLPQEAEMRVRNSDGRTFPGHAWGVPIVVDGEVVGVHGIFRPATIH